MDHARQHPQSGKRVSLRLRALDVSGRLHTGQLVKVVDWADRHTGMPWEVFAKEPGEPRDYLHRLGSRARDDVDVVVVTPDGHRFQAVYLVHADEIGKEVPGDRS